MAVHGAGKFRAVQAVHQHVPHLKRHFRPGSPHGKQCCMMDVQLVNFGCRGLSYRAKCSLETGFPRKAVCAGPGLAFWNPSGLRQAVSDARPLSQQAPAQPASHDPLHQFRPLAPADEVFCLSTKVTRPADLPNTRVNALHT